MHHTQLLLLISIHHSVAEIATLSLGNIEQYSTSLANTPSMTGSRVMITNLPDSEDAKAIIISNELRSSIEQVITKDCKNISDQCVQSVRSTIFNPNTELESRQAGLGMVVISAFLAVINIIGASVQFSNSKEVPVAIKVQDDVISQASKAFGASTVAIVTGGDAPVATITLDPVSTTVSHTGSLAPHVTTITSDDQGHHSGDLVIELPRDTAGRLMEIIARSTDCPAGDSFNDKTKGRRLKQRVDDDWGAVICASEQILLNTGADLAFGDLLALRLEPLRWSAQEAVRAMGVVLQSARDLAGDMGVTPNVADSIGVAVFALVTFNLIQGQPLGTENTIPGDKLKGTMTVSATLETSTKTSTSSSSSNRGPCTASCRMVGAIKDCETSCPGGRPTSMPESEREIKTVTIQPWKVLPVEAWAPVIDPYPACQKEESVDFPEITFNKTIEKFCSVAGKPSSNISWHLNEEGKNLTTPTTKRGIWQSVKDIVVTRENKANEQNELTLQWTTNTEIGLTCARTCKEAFPQLAFSDCKNDGRMGKGGGLYIGCGTYSFSIDPPPGKNTEAKITCRNHQLSAPQHDSDAQGGTSMESAIKQWCEDNDGKDVTSSKEIWQRYGITELGVSDRRSFWLRASLSCGNSETMHKEICQKSLLDGMKKCDPDSSETHGETASLGCLDYSTDMSGVTRDDNPAWSEKPHYPPPEYAPSGNGDGPNRVVCYPSEIQPGSFLSEDQTNQAIAAYCSNEVDIKGFGGERLTNAFDYPPNGKPQFPTNDKRYVMHLGMVAETIDNNGGRQFYADPAWCEGFDQKIHKDDCTYALRKILNDCKQPDVFIGGAFVYRCANYGIFHTIRRA